VFCLFILFDGKVNLVDALGEGGKNLKFSVVFKSAVKKKCEKREFLRKIGLGF